MTVYKVHYMLYQEVQLTILHPQNFIGVYLMRYHNIVTTTVCTSDNAKRQQMSDIFMCRDLKHGDSQQLYIVIILIEQ